MDSKDHQRALLQVRRDAHAGVNDVGNVRFAVLVQRRRHADDHGLHFPDALKVRGGGKAAGLDRLGDGGRFDVFDVALPLVEGGDLGRINVQPQNTDARAGELE